MGQFASWQTIHRVENTSMIVQEQTEIQTTTKIQERNTKPIHHQFSERH